VGRAPTVLALHRPSTSPRWVGVSPALQPKYVDWLVSGVAPGVGGLQVRV
jgi:hypothetical protein